MHLLDWSTSREIPHADAPISGKFGVTGRRLTYRRQPLSVTLSSVRDKSRHEHTECEVILVPQLFTYHDTGNDYPRTGYLSVSVTPSKILNSDSAVRRCTSAYKEFTSRTLIPCHTLGQSYHVALELLRGRGNSSPSSLTTSAED